MDQMKLRYLTSQLCQQLEDTLPPFRSLDARNPIIFQMVVVKSQFKAIVRWFNLNDNLQQINNFSHTMITMMLFQRFNDSTTFSFMIPENANDNKWLLLLVELVSLW